MSKKILFIPLLCALFVCACDLQPKIASIPDSIGIFIEDRYPALLADPETQPEIYNSAVTDYGVYASPELYGSSNIDDYVLYASIDDYVLVPETESEAQQSTDEIIEQEIREDYIVVPVYGGNTVIDENDEENIVVPDKKMENPETNDTIIVVRGDTVYSLARKNNMTVDEFAKINDLHEPYTLSIGQKLTARKPIQTKPVKAIPNIISQEKIQEIKNEKHITETVKPNATKRVDLQEIVIVPGDTLYSISRKYEIPVNDLAVMNKISAPFTLSVGQKIKVPKLQSVQTRSVTQIKATNEQKITPAKHSVKETTNVKPVIQKAQTPKKQPDTQVAQTTKKNTNTNQKPKPAKIVARSSSKFSWPVRGKILSGYGPKSNGLVNDGINISASRGTNVRAAENGVVAYSGNEVKGMGNLIIVQHSDGWMTVYAHLDSMNVKRGNKVNVGGVIGSVGQTGKVDKPQLHFEIRKGTKSYNPIQYLKK